MKSFKNFINELKGSRNVKFSSFLNQSCFSLLSSDKRTQTFLRQIISILDSESFLSALSNSIDSPDLNESEEDFVKRCSEHLEKLIETSVGLGESKENLNVLKEAHLEYEPELLE